MVSATGVLSVDLGGFWEGLPDRRPNTKTWKFTRYRYPAKFDLGSFSEPLTFYLETLKILKQINIHRSLEGILTKFERMTWGIKEKDHIIRTWLKALSKFCFDKTSQLGYLLLMGLEQLGGPAPWTKEQISADIEEWTGPKNDVGTKHFRTRELERIFSKWRGGGPTEHLKFKQFCQDPVRWGTSGGAPRSEFMGEKYRNKWAWAFSRLCPSGKIRYEVDLYEEALKEGTVCHVALKEEPSKTREVITTPMASYLRQSYLLYRWGRPRLDSPLAGPMELHDMQQYSYKWYGCIDGDRFDHGISKNVIAEIIAMFGTLDSECRLVAEIEIESLSSLEIEWFGNLKKWEGGLLSGWRMTSIIGSIVSDMAARWVIEDLGLYGSKYLVQGDDLILYSNTGTASREELVTSYERFGLKANLRKTLTGPVGDFLKKRYHPLGVLGVPAIGLRSVFYANPWISSYEFEAEEESCHAWLTFLSRIMPYRQDDEVVDWIKHHMIQTLSKFGNLDWDAYIHSPIGCGGGGPVEFLDPRKLVSLRTTYGSRRSIWSLFGLSKEKKKLVINKNMSWVPYKVAISEVKDIRSKGMDLHPWKFKDNVNIFEVLIEVYNGELKWNQLQSFIVGTLPHSFRGQTKLSLVEFLLKDIKKGTMPLSIQTTPELLAPFSKFVKSASTIVSKYKFSITNISAAACWFGIQTFRNADVALGTM
ncbi:RNA-dependent RNA polymerase [Halyomorpha halys toti-like virus 1]|nr:RNA-dependent RNA polymerase [Halyomorpha halys toti-like virus 1]